MTSNHARRIRSLLSPSVESPNALAGGTSFNSDGISANNYASTIDTESFHKDTTTTVITERELTTTEEEQQQTKIATTKATTTTTSCLDALHSLLTQPSLLNLASESSSHPVGLDTVITQPYHYAGPGLGNHDECLLKPNELHYCLAGSVNPGTGGEGGIVFAGLCVPKVCTAHVLNEGLYNRGDYAGFLRDVPLILDQSTDPLQVEYVRVHQAVVEINWFLGTGYSCGDNSIPWTASGIGCCVVLGLLGGLVLIATFLGQGRKRKISGLVSTTTERVQKEEGDKLVQKAYDEEKVGLLLNGISSGDVPAAATGAGRNTSFGGSTDSPSSPSSTSSGSGSGGSGDESDSSTKKEEEGDGHGEVVMVPYRMSTSKLRNGKSYMTTELRNQNGSSSSYDGNTLQSEQDRTEERWYHKLVRCYDATPHWNRLLSSPGTTNSDKTKTNDNSSSNASSSSNTTLKCLDGLRTISILWIIFGHTVSIQSSVGYTNPTDFLPPDGTTSKLWGQLFFASRYGVDTFLLMGGFLVVRVLLKRLRLDREKKLKQDQQWKGERGCWSIFPSPKITFLFQYLTSLPTLLLHRLLRILPTYLTTLTIWWQIVPHLSSGPYWYRFHAFQCLCDKLWWTNLLFINNIVPPNTPAVQTCFYHSWYLAVDMQLFLLAPLFVLWYHHHPKIGLYTTVLVTLGLMILVSYLSYVRGWSVNTLDGAAVIRFDEEGYASPHVRASGYMAGMVLGMWHDGYVRHAAAPAGNNSEKINKGGGVGINNDNQSKKRWWRNFVLMSFSIGTLLLITFITTTGAYARRPCQPYEEPSHNDCGSTWSPILTYLYTSFSRPLWSLSIALLVALCLTNNGGMVNMFLSSPIFVPFGKLSFGAYLIHPMVAFVYMYSLTYKLRYSGLNLAMTYIAVVAVTFVLALCLGLMVEFPLSSFSREMLMKKNRNKLGSSLSGSRGGGGGRGVGRRNGGSCSTSTNGGQVVHLNGGQSDTNNGNSSGQQSLLRGRREMATTRTYGSTPSLDEESKPL